MNGDIETLDPAEIRVLTGSFRQHLVSFNGVVLWSYLADNNEDVGREPEHEQPRDIPRTPRAYNKKSAYWLRPR